MKSFLLPVGYVAGRSLPTVLAALSCGAAAPLADLDILHLADREPDTLLPSLVQDLNGDCPLLASSFRFEAYRPQLPSLSDLSSDSAGSALIAALRGKGLPLSAKTDREAVEWAFSAWLDHPSASPLTEWKERIRSSLEAGEEARVFLLCDLCDPFSAGAVFALVRYLCQAVPAVSGSLLLLCLARRSSPETDLEAGTLLGAVTAMEEQALMLHPGEKESAPVRACWLLSLPSSLNQSDGAWRIPSVVIARLIGQFGALQKLPASGLHTVEIPGILTLSALGDQAKSLAAFVHSAVWLLSDLIPALRAYLDHPSALRSLSPNSRNGLFKRLFPRDGKDDTLRNSISSTERALKAILLELLSLIRCLPDPLRLPEVSGPVWEQAVAACGRTVTVASEFDVSTAEAEEAGIMQIKPVHRVSLADTEEEKQQRRLDEIAAQLKEETAQRDRLLSAMGGCYAHPALLGCLRRCREALTAAEEKARELASAPETSHLALAAQARRVRLLQAAVQRCTQDLNAPLSLSDAQEAPSDAATPLFPFSSRLLVPEAAEKLSAFLLADPDGAESIRKELRALLPTLFAEGTLSEGKTLLRELLSSVSDSAALSPFYRLISAVKTVSLEEISALRFLSAGSLPSFPLLPDLFPEKPLLTLSALLSLLRAKQDTPADSDADRRGLLACLLLRQYRRRTSEEAFLSFETLTQDASPVVRAWLTARRADQVQIVSLSLEHSSVPFALILPGKDILPARRTSAHVSFLPVFASPWFDQESLVFRDPCGLVSEGDNQILLEQLGRLKDSLPSGSPSPLREFLSAFLRDLSPESLSSVLPDQLGLRLKAAFGLRLLPAFSSVLVRETCFYEHFLRKDEMISSLAGGKDLPASLCGGPDDVVYCYRDVPFARESSKTLLAAIPLPQEDYILNLLAGECRMLERSSDDYHDALVRELSLLLERYPDASAEARELALQLLEKASSPVQEAVPDLVWPWDPHSPSILTVLTESLGENLASLATRPFSDRLAVFPARGGEVIGDALFSGMCLLQPDMPSAPVDGASESQPDPRAENQPALQSDALLPPLSGDFAHALCRLPEGRTLVRPGLLSFERTAEGVRAILTLDGAFPLRLVRTYSPEEIVNLYAHDIPTLAVWPNLPFSPEDWKAYLIYASLSSSLDIRVYLADGSSLSPVRENTSRSVSRTASFPLCFSLMKGEETIGSVLNLLPTPELSKQDSVTAAIDFGSVGTSVVLFSGHRRQPLQGASMVRTLLNNPSASRDLLRKEFLPAVPVSALLPTASRIFRNVPGAAPLPFEDGIVLMSSSLQDVLSIPSGSLYTCLKWEEEKGRSVVLCLHQIMLMTALQARSDGLASITWRFAIPDGMAKTGREKLRELFLLLAENVNEAAGFPIPENQPLVTFAAESAALGAYFRLCAAEDTRGGFMVLDIGACTADISLFLRGREQAVRTCQLPLGIHYMLLPSLLRDPSLLRQELGYVQDPLFLRDLALLEQILLSARADPAALRQSRIALDSFIADRSAFLLPALLYHPDTGGPTRLGSLLLLHFSFLMMLSGLILLQISADPGRNDFLPEQMSLCLAGRGSLLLEGLPDPVKTGFWHCLTMFRNSRVSSLSLLFSSEKKLEIPVGLSVLQEATASLPDSSAIPAAISVRPEDLLPQFLLRFAKEFPASAALLFPGFFSGDFYHPFTPWGESLVTAAIDQSFTAQTALKPFDALSAWIGCLLDLVASSGT